MWVTIEGNIGCGKTTLLEALKAKHPEWIFAPEPVDLWTVPQPALADKSMLDVFQENPKAHGAFFQTQALATRLKILKALSHPIESNRIVISERTPETDAHVFAPLMDMTAFEKACYTSIYDALFDPSQLGIVIYLQTDPKICLERIHKRGRSSETNIDLDYLRKLHKQHEDYISKTSKKLFVVDNNFQSKQDVYNRVESILTSLQL